MNRKRKIYLASASPRRAELLKLINIDFTTLPSDVDETVEDDISADILVKQLAMLKACDAAKKCKGEYIVIAADTVVCIDDEILGKPKDESDAVVMLKKLSGKIHTVYTGICLASQDGTVLSRHCATKVKFKALSDETINAYVKTGEPMDKAGAYGIQGLGSVLVESVEGDYFNIVGLSVSMLSDMLKEFDYNVL